MMRALCALSRNCVGEEGAEDAVEGNLRDGNRRPLLMAGHDSMTRAMRQDVLCSEGSAVFARRPNVGSVVEVLVEALG
jgi:hypothetical protein